MATSRRSVSRSRSSTTAERLQLTSSRISQTLRDLERKLGGRLVNRSTRRVALTPLGERFLADVAPVVEQLSGVLGRWTERCASACWPRTRAGRA